jgi:glutaredoxin 3
MATVEMYTTMTCGSCIRAKRLLASKGVEVTEIDVSFDRSAMIQRANGRMTVPQIFIDDEGIGGFDDLAALDRKGHLDAMLGLISDGVDDATA